MLKKRQVSGVLVFGVIVLLIGMSIVPIISGNIGEANSVKDVAKRDIDSENINKETKKTENVQKQDSQNKISQPEEFILDRGIEPDEWWNNDWLYRKEITIDHTKIDEDHTKAPKREPQEPQSARPLDNK